MILTDIISGIEFDSIKMSIRIWLIEYEELLITDIYD